MRLAVMQPYFFPYAGYFRLIAGVDRFVVFDTAQFLRRGWMHRNRVSDGLGGWRWIRASLQKAPRETALADMRLREDVDWRRPLLEGLEVYAPLSERYASTRDLVNRCLDVDTDSLVRLNLHALTVLAEALDLEFEPLALSGTGVDPGPTGDPQGRMLAIAKALGASEIVNLPGGRKLYDVAAFDREGLRLSFLEAPGQLNAVPGREGLVLSIIDDLMRFSPAALRERVAGAGGANQSSAGQL